MSEQRGRSDLAWNFVCRGCGRRTWSAFAECAACLYARTSEPEPEQPGQPPDEASTTHRPVEVSRGLGWPTQDVPGDQRSARIAVGWVSSRPKSPPAPPAPLVPPVPLAVPLSSPRMLGSTATELSAPAAEPSPTQTTPASGGVRPPPSSVETGDPPVIPAALLAARLDPLADRERTMSWWDELLTGVDADVRAPEPGWLMRHWHGVRATLVVMLVAAMAVLYSGLGLLVVWAVLVIPALLVRLHKRRLSRASPSSGSYPR